ncbi:MAG: hypothetical protein HDS82_03530 [Bacteroidales bacterium]|nr:hypothetical protein [Bacteroidales bacterium]
MWSAVKNDLGQNHGAARDNIYIINSNAHTPMHNVYNRLLSLLLILLVALPLSAGRWDEEVGTFVASSGVSQESIALLVIDLSDGKTLCSHNEKKPLVPASIMKAVTIATLLEKCGPDWRYRTRICTTGSLRDGVLEGNIVVEGCGDPSVNSTSGPDSPDIVQSIVDALQEKDVRKIKGKIIVDCSYFPAPAVPPSWAKGDLAHYYGTGCHGFNFENNAVGKSAVSDPSAKFRTRLSSALAAAGIELCGQEISDGKRREQLTLHLSAPIDEIMRSCMMRSDNLFAEAFLRTYAALNDCPATPSEGARLELAYWKKRGLPTEGVNIVDGSGLSRSDRMTALFMGKMLTDMSDDEVYASFFPLAGQEGTLKKFLAGTPLDSYIAMKTGSMNGIQCYAGYKLDDDYAPTHVIVMMANEMKDRGRLRGALQSLLLKIFG